MLLKNDLHIIHGIEESSKGVRYLWILCNDKGRLERCETEKKPELHERDQHGNHPVIWKMLRVRATGHFRSSRYGTEKVRRSPSALRKRAEVLGEGRSGALPALRQN